MIFEGTDPYWARSRTLEYLSTVTPSFPSDARTALGPDATGLGWVYEYVVSDPSGKHSLQELRSIQDWSIRYRLKSVPGVPEVALRGRLQQQYQVNVDPNRLRVFGVALLKVVEAIRGGHSDSSGRRLEFGGSEYMIRGRGYVKSLADIENIVVRARQDGTAIRVKDLGAVAVGPDLRRGRVAVWIGIRALLGVDAETRVFMLLYLDLAYHRARQQNCMNTREDLHKAIYEGAVKRAPEIHDCRYHAGRSGADHAVHRNGIRAHAAYRGTHDRRILTSFLLELLVYPIVYEIWKWRAEVSRQEPYAAEMMALDSAVTVGGCPNG